MGFEFEAIGTHWQIDSPEGVSENTQQKILETINEFDAIYSRFRQDSLVTKISQEAGMYQLPPDAKPLIDLYQKLYSLTDGLFTPLIGNTLEDAGYDRNYSLKPRKVNAPLEWSEAIEYDFPNLKTKSPVTLDFGAGGKGYLIDIVSEILKSEGVKTFTVDAGGDILHFSENKETVRIALENPEDITQAIGVAEISNESIAGSAGNRRKWEEFHHIINPKTLRSPKEVSACWVTAKTTIEADAIGTCLFLNPDLANKLNSEFQFEYLILFSNQTIKKSTNFPAEIFYEIHR